MSPLSRMVKEQRGRERSSERGGRGEWRLLISFIWSCASQVKLLLVAALLLLCFLVTLLVFHPVRFPLSSSPCIPTASLSASQKSSLLYEQPPGKDEAAVEGQQSSPTPRQQSVAEQEPQQKGVVKPSFHPVGTAAYNFILMSAYRGGSNTFIVLGLASKPLHVYGHPTYTCEYQSGEPSTSILTTVGHKLDIPDFGFARVYTTAIINCTFQQSSLDPSSGGKLLLHAHTNGGFDADLNLTDTVQALVEAPNSWDPSQFLSSDPTLKYKFLYCGSPLYGNLSPQRIREWIAYHVRLFGEQSHFVIQDAGGIHPEVMEVLKPWMELGLVTLQDIREQERFDGFYHNQVLILNDCLNRYRFQTKWMFFFDVDEYIYVNPETSISSVMESFDEFTQISIEQMPMSNKLCLAEDADGKSDRKWGFEKLVYRSVKKERKDRKYAIQPKNVFATGVHMSHIMQGRSTRVSEKVMKYFHYHSTVAERRKDACRHGQVVNKTSVTLDGTHFVLDTTIKTLGPSVKRFELATIGSKLERTRQ